MNNPQQGLEIGVDELADELERGAEIQLLDIRAEHRLAAGAVEVNHPASFHNIRGSEILAADDPGARGLDPDIPVVVVCGQGNDSRVVARFLGERGYSARSMSGGVLAWMRMTVPRHLDPPDGFDRFVQFDRLGKASLAYLLVSDDEAIVIDPPRDVGPIMRAMEEAGAHLVAVVDTHVHADYLSGGPKMAAEADVPYLIHPGDSIYPYDGTPGNLSYEPLHDGQQLAIGRGMIDVIHTPGHTLGSVTLVAGSNEALTGDFAFIDSIGRPDLAGKTEEWTEDLWRSLERVRAAWGGEMVIRPAHYAGESERNADRSIGRQWSRLLEENEALKIKDPAEFAVWIASNVTTPPEAYPKIKAANVGLLEPTPEEADVLEAGKNECAVG
jgi:glyoxylase-like metal-dependent hydrolase (beta-lactamase superfamily II)